MNVAWIRVDDASLPIWALHIVKKIEEATVLNSADAQQLARGANDRFTGYRWGSIAVSGPEKCVVQGTEK